MHYVLTTGLQFITDVLTGITWLMSADSLIELDWAQLLVLVTLDRLIIADGMNLTDGLRLRQQWDILL
jgi:hypothetical protein